MMKVSTVSEKNVHSFMEGAIEIESKAVIDIITLADKCCIDRNKAISTLASVIVTFSDLSDASKYEPKLKKGDK